jgi:hypothetical protein
MSDENSPTSGAEIDVEEVAELLGPGTDPTAREPED